VPANAVFRGLGPFIAVDVVRLLLLLLAPPVVLFLPRLMS
jgi:TRAP-type C4-dicarboxylate transport system permease large subunit